MNEIFEHMTTEEIASKFGVNEAVNNSFTQQKTSDTQKKVSTAIECNPEICNPIIKGLHPKFRNLA